MHQFAKPYRVGTLVFITTMSALSLPVRAESVPRPNFVIMFVDNLGMNDVSCYGSEIPTPHIDGLAREGIKFERWYSASPVCTPSRFGLLTGRLPNRSQDRLLSALMPTSDRDRDRGIRPHETTFARVLHDHGYRTACIGKWHLGHGDVKFLPTRHGFDSFYGLTPGCIDYFTMRYGQLRVWYHDEQLVDETGYATDLLADEAVKFIESQSAGRPFLLYLPFNAPHYGKLWDDQQRKYLNPLQPRERELALVEHIPEGDRRDYAAMVVALDAAVGRIVAALSQQRLDSDTWVVFLSDNGAMTRYGGQNTPFRGRIATPFEGGIRVPCVMRWTGKLPSGISLRQPCSTLDLFPTICHFAGVAVEELPLDGIPIPGVLLEGDEFERDLFWELGTRYGGAALVRGQWKYVRTKADGDMLFHLASDPGERWNLAEERPALLAELMAAHQRIAATLSD